MVTIYSNNYGVYWTYVMVVAAFMVVNRRSALVFNLVFILIVVLLTAELMSPAISLRLTVTLSLVTIFSYVFSTRIQERTKALLIHLQELDTANSVKSEFIANMSHEMRTPLTAVLGYSESLLAANDLSNDGREKLNAVVFGARHLARLIDDVLDTNKAESGHLEVSLEITELVPLMDKLIKTLEPEANAKRIELQLTTGLSMPRYIYTDPVRLNQILMNLMGNAIKFTETGSVNLSVEYQASKNAMVFRVIDTGIGIAEDFQEVLFEKFSQADSGMNRKHGGTGLGLYISRNLAMLLRGDLEYIPQQRGSIFQLAIDAGSISKERLSNHEAIDGTQSTVPPSESEFKGHVLLAEDSPANQLLIGLMLEKFGLTHSAVSNGREALEKLRTESFDLVLMDLQMPIMSGIEAAMAIRRFNREVPIVALSADVLRHDQDSKEMKGFTAFLAKPMDVMKMRAVFARLLPAGVLP